MNMAIDTSALAHELLAAYATGTPIATPPSARDAGFDLAQAYAVEAELVRLRRAGGRSTVGRKVGFASKAMWRMLKLDTLVWAHMYRDTVHEATGGEALLALGHRYSPRIEPEMVVKLRAPIAAGTADAAAVLASVDWLAIGFEINDCLFPDWTFQPADFVAAFGFHTALVVGTPVPVTPDSIPGLAQALSTCTVRLLRDGQLVDEGSGRNSLKSPALCVAELAAAIARRPAATPLGAGEIVSTGTLTAAHPIAAGDTWRVEVSGLELGSLTLRVNG
jgi:2-oxo-3-hexenedioate decarboxylase